MQDTNKLVTSGWVIAILGLAAAGRWEDVAMALIGLAGQWIKALKGIPTWGTQLGMVALCLLLYVALHRPSAFPPPDAWTHSALVWALAVLGSASFAGGTGAAAKTDSIAPPQADPRKP